MIPTRIWACVVLVALVGCKDKKPQTPKLAQVFPNLPLPPQASVVSRSGGTDALQITLMSQSKAADVESYYRQVLTRNGWRLVNDMRDRDGSMVFFAERDGPPLWVRIKSTDDSVATLVELSGAVMADPAKRAKPAS